MEFLASFYDVLILLFLEQNVVAWLASWLIGSEKLRPTEWGLLARSVGVCPIVNLVALASDPFLGRWS